MHFKTTLLALTAVLASVHALDANVDDTNDASKIIYPAGPGYNPVPYSPYPVYYPPSYPPSYPGFYPGYPGSILYGSTHSNRLAPRHDVTNILNEDKKSPKVIIEGHQQRPKLFFGGDQEKLEVNASEENAGAEDENGESKFWNPYWWSYRRGLWGWGNPWGGSLGYPGGPWGPYGRRRF
ncbi:hypothetical protein MVEG_04449 [Podila verticillata NRRL 6337]|nr:hypothetical protein MVEG_04449 [Podila verticillata NRRL 6337]